MSRYARERRTPNVRRKQRVELEEGNITLRLLGVGVAIVIAAVAFSTVISNLLQVQTGWQTIEPANPETGIAQQFTLTYQIGAAHRNATVELKAVSALYSEAMDHGYRVLSNVEQEPYTNFYTLNQHPNQVLTVDPLLYQTLQTLEAENSRHLYYAPVLEQYASLFGCTDDSSAEKFDPEKSPAVAQFASEIAAFARNPQMVNVELLPENQVKLTVAQEYLDYAEENGVESFVDLGILLNAFLCDAAADALTEQGYQSGVLTSFDGFIRVLCPEQMGLPVYDLVDGKVLQIGQANYNGPAALTLCRSFPVSQNDQSNYYIYSDGTIRAPYIAEDGQLRTAVSALVTRDTGSAASLAIRTLCAYTGETLNTDALENASWIVVENGSWTICNDGFSPA